MAKPNTQSTQSTQTKAQQAELDRMRKAKQAAQTKEAETVEAVKTQFAESSQPEEDSVMDRAKQAAMEMLMRGAGLLDSGVSWKRYLAAFFASAVLAYGISSAVGTLAGYAMIGIATLGGSLLWAYLIMVIAVMLTVYASFKATQHVGNYILSGQIDRDVIGAYNKVKVWFGRKEIVIAA